MVRGEYRSVGKAYFILACFLGIDRFYRGQLLAGSCKLLLRAVAYVAVVSLFSSPLGLAAFLPLAWLAGICLTLELRDIVEAIRALPRYRRCFYFRESDGGWVREEDAIPPDGVQPVVILSPTDFAIPGSVSGPVDTWARGYSGITSVDQIG